MKNRPIVIYAPSFSRMRGGIVVLHKLCYLLNKCGFESYLAPSGYVGGWFWYGYDNTPIVSQHILEQNFVAVYPELVEGNPLNAKQVIRWILSNDQTAYRTYGKDDIIYWYDGLYYSDKLGFSENELHVIETNKHLFYDKFYNRIGSCYTSRKNNNPTFHHPNDSVSITWEMTDNWELLSNIFNITERFYCYDLFTFLSIQSIMCGCVCIIPNDVVSDPKIYQDHFLMKAIAFGEEDIPRALGARPSFLKYIDDDLKKEMMVDVIKFGVMCNNL